jgi:hypothetical protein
MDDLHWMVMQLATAELFPGYRCLRHYRGVNVRRAHYHWVKVQPRLLELQSAYQLTASMLISGSHIKLEHNLWLGFTVNEIWMSIGSRFQIIKIDLNQELNFKQYRWDVNFACKWELGEWSLTLNYGPERWCGRKVRFSRIYSPDGDMVLIKNAVKLVAR